MLFTDLDEETRRKAIAFLEASLEDEPARRTVLHLSSHPQTRRGPRLVDQSGHSTLKRCA